MHIGQDGQMHLILDFLQNAQPFLEPGSTKAANRRPVCLVVARLEDVGNVQRSHHTLDDLRHSDRVLFALDHAGARDQKKVARPNVNIPDLERDIHRCGMAFSSAGFTAVPKRNEFGISDPVCVPNQIQGVASASTSNGTFCALTGSPDESAQTVTCTFLTEIPGSPGSGKNIVAVTVPDPRSSGSPPVASQRGPSSFLGAIDGHRPRAGRTNGE